MATALNTETYGTIPVLQMVLANTHARCVRRGRVRLAGAPQMKGSTDMATSSIRNEMLKLMRAHPTLDPVDVIMLVRDRLRLTNVSNERMMNYYATVLHEIEGDRKATPSPITKPQDFTAPCGCKTRFDNDGFVRLEQCLLHHAAPQLLSALESLIDAASWTPTDNWTIGPMDSSKGGKMDTARKAIAEAKGQ